MNIKLLLLVFISLLSACATVPEFDTKNVEFSLTPEQVINKPAATRGKTVVWGGTILDIKNLEKATRLEILAYPLNDSYRPLTDQKPLGRFIILHSGYLEPTTYAQGKQLSVLGKVNGTQSGKVGETRYTYALIKSQQLHLWSKESETQTFFHFGIGVQL